jgi:hypothetical protein
MSSAALRLPRNWATRVAPVFALGGALSVALFCAAEVQAEEAKADAKPADTKDAKPADATPADAKPADAKDAKPADAKDAKPADAPVDPKAEKAWENAPYEHRGGFAVGLSLGLGVGAANGFPADARKIGREEFYTESGLGLSTLGSLWIGGALADWLTFGVGGGFALIRADGTESPAPFMFFHTDIYPLYGLEGAFRNLGMTTDFGLAFAKTTDNETGDVLIDAGGASHLFVGAFFEGIEVWKMKMGPSLGLDYMFSQTLRRPSAIAGFRVSLYTLP